MADRIINFKSLMLAVQSDLANETFKDPYICDFIALKEALDEILACQIVAGVIQGFLNKLGYTKPGFDKTIKDTYKNHELLKRVDWHWTYDAKEWCIFQKEPVFGIKTIKDVFNTMEVELSGRGIGLNSGNPEDIVLIHDHTQTTPFFETIVDKLLSKQLLFNDISKV